MSENLAGKTIKEHYYLESMLGSSGFGTIYLSRDIKSAVGSRYIIKHFCPSYNNQTQQEQAITLFKQESNSLQKLGNHPQIPRIYDFFIENNNFFLVQELIEGETLQEELAKTGNFSSAKAIKLLVSALEVLKFVHQSGHIHRDIKPTNLIVNRFDNRIFIINFGAIREKINPHNFDEDGTFLPTSGILNPGYTPDEQLHGRPEFCSDLYALGMVMIEAMTKEHPSNLPRNVNLQLIWRDRLLSHLTYNTDFLDLVDRMVEQKWQERYQSADIVLEELKSIILASNTGILKSEPEIIAESGELVTVKPVAKPVTKQNPSPQIIPVQAVFKPDLPQEKTSSKNKSNKFKVLSGWGILGALFISFLLYLDYSRSQKYITYKNEQIEVQYPQGWLKENSGVFLDTTVVFISPKESSSDRFQERVAIIVEQSPKPTSLKEYSDRSVSEIKSLDNSIISPAKSTTLSGSDAKYVLYQGTIENLKLKRKKVWTVDYQQIYTVVYTAQPDKFEKFLPQATRMIESLKIVR